MDELPSQWALDEAAKRSSWRRWDEVRGVLSFPGMQNTNDAIVAHARTIEKHEQPPVDQDVLDVRELLAVWRETSGYCITRCNPISEEYRNGDFDHRPDFQAALAKYREFKARDNGAAG